MTVAGGLQDYSAAILTDLAFTAITTQRPPPPPTMVTELEHAMRGRILTVQMQRLGRSLWHQHISAWWRTVGGVDKGG